MKKYRYIVSILFLFGLIYYGYTYYKVYRAECNEKQMIEAIMPWHIEEDIWTDNHAKKECHHDGTETLTEESVEKSVREPVGVSPESVAYKENTTESIPQDMDCILQIPAINLEKIVYTGHNRSMHLEKYELVTASDDMQYIHGGNYIICGHASRLYGHSLNRLNELQVGDEVIIWNKGKFIQYEISSVSFENMNHTSEYCEQTEYSQLTIISCAKYVGNNQYIVIKCK